MEYDAGADADLTNGTMRAVELGGLKLLIAKIDGVCHAMENTCPHAGAMLSEGVLAGEQVICPWHKAAFNVRTGRRAEPPAVDDLAAFQARCVDGRILVDLDPSKTLLDERCMVIIGAGAAGSMAAQTLREEGFAGRVILVSEESEVPYDRTVLSKYVLSGKQGGEKSPLQNAEFYQRHRIERLLKSVHKIDPAERVVRFADGDTLAYHSALVAPGGKPQALKVPGADRPGVFLLRSASDASAIANAASHARSAVVVGASFIGMEAAASLRERGLEVTVVAPQKVPFESKLGPEVGRAFRTVHEREGIVFRLQDEIASIEGASHVERVRLRSGDTVKADLVVVGLGVSPATGLLGGLKLMEDGGVPVDAQLRAAEHLYVAGDVAAFPLRGDGERIRVEHWRVAQQHGRIAALNMLGRAQVYNAVPYFWTIHFLKRLDYVGHADQWDNFVIDGDLEEPSFLAYYIQAGIVAAVAGWGRDRQMAAAIRLMERHRDWPVTELTTALEPFA